MTEECLVESPIAETRMLFRNQSVSPLGGSVDCGFIKNGSGIPGNSRLLGAYALVYVAYGSGSYRDEGHKSDLGASDMVVVLPSTRHWYGTKVGSAFDTLHVIFEGPLFDAWLAAGILNPGRPVIRLDPVEYWLGAMESSLGSGNQASPRRSMDEALSLQAFLAEITLADAVDESRGSGRERPSR